MQFQHTEHELRFKQMTRWSGMNPNDIERTALFYLLSCDLLAGLDLYNWEEHLIKPEALEQEPLTTSQRAMVQLAFNLYNGFGDWTVLDIFKFLDEQNSRLALEAIRIRFKISE